MIRSDPVSAMVSPYRRRLGLFAALKALAAGVTALLFALGVSILIMKILQKNSLSIPALAAASAFVITCIFVFLVSYPSYNYTAKKIDSLGLKERTSTMFALSGSDTEIAALQRNDAIIHLRDVKTDKLKDSIGSLIIILLISSMIFAAVCALIPASWFERAEDGSAAQVWEEVLEMLREEQQRLEEQGEEALSEEMKDLVGKLEQNDSILNAIGDINDAEENAVEDVLNGEADPRAGREMIDVLEEAKRMLLDLEEAEAGEEGEGMEGEAEIMAPGEGEEGEEQEGRGEGEGEEPGEGEERDQNGNGHGRGFEGDEGVDGVNNMTEQIYDPISGSVQYGDVFSVYFSEYLRDSENGGIPFELKDAADAYFSILDR